MRMLHFAWGGLFALVACSAQPQAALSRADALLASGQAAKAEQLLRGVVRRLDAEAATQQTHRALEIEVLGQLAQLNASTLHNIPQAIADYTAIIRLAPLGPAGIDAQRQLADVYTHRSHQPELAVALLRSAAQALGSRSEGAQVRQSLYTTLMAMGNYDAAYTEAVGIVERWPISPEAISARLTMGRADYMEGRFVRGAATFEALMDSTQNAVTQAVAMVEAGNCYQNLGEPDRALTFYYAALKAHPNAAMVQDKIRRVRERLYHMAPREGILNASRPSRHIAAWLPRPTPQELGVGAPILQR